MKIPQDRGEASGQSPDSQRRSTIAERHRISVVHAEAENVGVVADQVKRVAHDVDPHVGGEGDQTVATVQRYKVNLII